MTMNYKFGLVGHNTAYSKSPEIFHAIFNIKKVAGTFNNYVVEPDRFEEQFKSLIESGLQGFSITIPYKKRIIPLLNDIDPVAKAIEAVNSVYVDSGKLYGCNTDCFGFSLPLRAHSNRLKHGRALILGCGGGAKAAVYSLYTDYEMKQFIVLSRNQSHLENFRSSLKGQIRGINIESATFQDFKRMRKKKFDIIVNCTPLGGWNYPGRSPFPDEIDLPSGKIYYDLNYNDNNTMITRAETGGFDVIDGSYMLVGQAIRSFNIWTGEDVPFDDVYNTVFGS